MDEVTTFAKAGETAGAAVGTGVQAARKQAARTSKQLAERASEAGLADRWEQVQGKVAERVNPMSEALAEQLVEKRRELAAKIEPEKPAPRRSRRWLWLLLAVATLGAVAAAIALLGRRPHEMQPVESVGYRGTNEGPTGTPSGNGALNSERPSANAD